MKYDLTNICDTKLPTSLNKFLTYLGTIKGKSPNTLAGYRYDLIMFFRFQKLYKKLVTAQTEFEDINISDIDEDFLKDISLPDLYAFISFSKDNRNNGVYARARKVATLKSFFKFLQGKEKVIINNVTLELESPKISKRNPVYLTLNESKDLLKCIEGKNKDRDYCIITLFLNCGMRLSELCGINISKIRDDTLTVIGKGNKERTIYLNNACLDAIKAYLAVRNINLDKIIDKDALFISRNNKRLNKRTIEIMVKKFITLAGLDYNKFSPHKLRHTAATLMYKYGNVDIRSLQEILGHSSVATTQIYTHVDDDKLREATNLNPLSGEKSSKE